MVLRNSLFLWGISFLLFACSGETESNPTNEPEEYTADGELIYLNSCAACHGVDGKLGASNAFDLSETKLNGDEIREVILKGRKSMPPFEGILKDSVEIEAVVSHLLTLKK